MNCRRIEELIPLYVEGDLGEPGASDVRSHIESCEVCRGLVSEYEASQAWLRAAESPDFDEAFVDTIRAGVMRELAAREAAPPFAEGLRQWLAPRRLVAATAALLLIFAAVLVFFLAGRSRVSPQKEQQAITQPQPAVEKKPESGNPEPDGKQATIQSGPRTPHRGASLVVRHTSRVAGRAVKPQEHLIAAHPPDTVPAAPKLDGSDASKSADMLRIEIQTADPNIRIIWFAPKPTDAETPNPMGETL
ncbi:MAG TPA: zf-HC2 domain-containing protein [Blastocatellia bacterium]|nr:zf-HC2 domain-containing protein [Blastocatellia bacterium]